jgi:hypothetical protein
MTANTTTSPSMKIAALELVARAARRLHPGSPVPGEPWLVQTGAGIKYIGRGFDSRHFDRYVVRTVERVPDAFSWDDLLISPDLLRDPFTHTGKPITRSPHFRLMQEIRDGRLGPDSEYIGLCAAGTLDARRGFAADPTALTRQFHGRAKELAARGEAAIHVFGPRQHEGREVYVIADGKHRAAQAALSMDTACLRLQVLADEVLAHPVFRKAYGAVMAGEASSFSINQKMVKLLRYE